MNEYYQSPVSRSKLIKAQFNEHHVAYLKIEKRAAFLCGDNFNCVHVSEEGVNIQAGVGKHIALQTMASHGPMHMKMIWPINLLCGPAAAPQCIPTIPLMPIAPECPPLAACLIGLSSPIPCWVAEELYGKNDIRTHYARLYAMVHDNFFTRLYRKYGIAWASFVKKHSWIKPLIEPIWKYMYIKGEIISNNCVTVFTKSNRRSK